MLRAMLRYEEALSHLGTFQEPPLTLALVNSPLPRRRLQPTAQS